MMLKYALLGLFVATFFPFCDASLLADMDKCLLWLKTDGTNCQPSSFFGLHKMALGYIPSLMKRERCCSDGTGCFTIDKDTPYECYQELPQCADVIKPEFLYYTPEKNQQVQKIDFFNLDRSIDALQITRMRNFFAIVHGFGADWPKGWMFNMKDHLNALDHDALIVRWTGGAKDPLYFQAASNTRVVGMALAMVMNKLSAKKKISVANSTIIGFSLGGQVAGYAGSNIPRLRRIIAIDPAGPFFQCMHHKARLDATDADFVQAIHTNGDYFLMGGCGTHQQFGDMDVYFNGGTQQPGCGRGFAQSYSSLLKLNFSLMVESSSCSHNRAPRLLTEILAHALNPEQKCQMVAFPCQSAEDWKAGECFTCPPNGCPTVGYMTDLNSGRTGRYYLNTLGENVTSGSWCGRQLKLTLVSDSVVKGKIEVIFHAQNEMSKPSTFQTEDETIGSGIAKSSIAVVPHNMKPIDKVEIKFTRNVKFMHISPKAWKIQSTSVQHVNGTKLTNQQEHPITSGYSILIPVELTDSADAIYGDNVPFDKK